MYLAHSKNLSIFIRHLRSLHIKFLDFCNCDLILVEYLAKLLEVEAEVVSFKI